MRIGLGALAIASLVALAGCRTLPPDRHARHVYRTRCSCATEPRTYEYLVHLPDGYEAGGQAATRWPLLVYLPGMFASGREKARPIRGGPPTEIEDGRDLPMIVLTPMTPTFLERWSPDLVVALIDHAIRAWHVDPARVYLTGVSIGGCGVWDVAQAYPERIAAAVPVAAWGSPRGIDRMVDVPVWAFHGGLDFVVPCALHARMVRAHRAAGGHARWTVLPGGFHWIWDDVYARDDLYRWLLAQRKGGSASRR